MKILTTLILIGLSLYGRSNPFVATDTFNEKRDQILNQQINNNKTIIVEEIIQDEPKILKKESINIEDGCKKEYNFKVLPFLSVQTNENSIIVDIKSKYKLINQDIDVDNKKLIFDFSGKTNFYTKHKKLCHKYFKSYSIGCHKKENYFRVVIALKDDLLKYKDSFNSKTNKIVIKYQ